MFLCELCGFKSILAVCDLCASEFNLYASSVHSSLSVESYVLYSYSGLIRHLIHSMKFNKRSCLAKYFGIKLGNFVLSLGISPEVVLPVPLHKKRFYKRGFNQSLIAAHQVAKVLNVPVDSNVIYRDKYTKPLSIDSNRLMGFDLGFKVNQHEYSSILVVDDVITTGYTLNSIIKQLACDNICVAVIAGV